MHARPFGRAGSWASSLIYGANQHRSPGAPSKAFAHSVVLESNIRLDDRNSVFGRGTFVQKSPDDLAVTAGPDERFNLGTLMLGYVREIATFSGAELGVGLRGEIGRIPEALAPAYGTRHPAGFAVFGRIRPRLASPAGMAPGMHGDMHMRP